MQSAVSMIPHFALLTGRIHAPCMVRPSHITGIAGMRQTVCAVDADNVQCGSTAGSTLCIARRRQILAGCAFVLMNPPCAATADTVNSETRATAAYDSYSAVYDSLDDSFVSDALGFAQGRQELLAGATGDVLEVAVGTGLNLPDYDWTRVQQLTAIDLSEGMLAQARERAAAVPLSGRPIRLQRADVEALPFADNSFDTVVSTFSLCVFPHPDAALRELCRVLRPGGVALLLEHSRSSNGLLAAYQDLTNAAVTSMSKGCAWNQDVLGLVRAAGLTVLASKPQLAGGLVVMVQATKL